MNTFIVATGKEANPYMFVTEDKLVRMLEDGREVDAYLITRKGKRVPVLKKVTQGPVKVEQTAVATLLAGGEPL